MALEAQLKDGSGPTEVQWTYINAQDAAISITDHEIIGIPGDSGKRIAAAVWAGTDVATPGTVAVAEECQVLIKGRVEVPKDTSVAFVQGGTAYWDASANKASDSTTAATTDDFVLGRVAKIAATADDTVLVDLNEGPSAYAMGSSSLSSVSSSSSSSSSSSTSA